MKHFYGNEGNAVPRTGFEKRTPPLACDDAPYSLTLLDVATLAAGATHHSADIALHHKLLAAGLLARDAHSGRLGLTEKAYTLLEENGYTFVPNQGWRLDTARAVRSMLSR